MAPCIADGETISASVGWSCQGLFSQQNWQFVS